MPLTLPSRRLLLCLSIGYAAVLSVTTTILYHLIRSGAASQEICEAHLVTSTTPNTEAIYSAFFIPFLPSGLTFMANLIVFCLITIGLPLLLLRKRSEKNAPLGPAVFIATILLTFIAPLSIHAIVHIFSTGECVSMGYLISPLVSGIAGIALFTFIADRTECSFHLKPLLMNYAALFIASVALFTFAFFVLPPVMRIEAVPLVLSLSYGWVLAFLLTFLLSRTDKSARIVAGVTIPVILLVPIIVMLLI